MYEYQNIFGKVFVPNWSKEVFLIKKVLCRGHLLLVILTVRKLFYENFKKKNCKRQIKRNLG